VETIHGTARILFLQPIAGDFKARQIAVFTGSILIVAVAYFFRRWIHAASIKESLLVGVIWVVLTIVFEISLGRLVLDLSWERIISDYDVSHGGLMIFGLVVMLFAPLIVSRIRMSRNDSSSGKPGGAIS
jgi:hypothetical protein